MYNELFRTYYKKQILLQNDAPTFKIWWVSDTRKKAASIFLALWLTIIWHLDLQTQQLSSKILKSIGILI